MSAFGTLSQQLRYEDYEVSAKFILSNTKHRPRIAIVCGSGLSGIGDDIENGDVLQYQSIPNFPVSTVEGHKGQMLIGLLNGVPVVCLQGRCHMFEGNPPWKCAVSVRILHLMDIKYLIVTNAAGSTNPRYKPGDIVLIRDHVNLPGLANNNPLTGHNDERLGPRFPPMDNCYDKNLRRLAMKVSKDLGGVVHKKSGVYCSVGGPCYETKAELRMMSQLGMDLVGMSTAPEVTVASHCGIRVLGFSLVTNSCLMDDDSDSLDSSDGEQNGAQSMNIHSDVLEIGNRRKHDMIKLIKAVAPAIIEKHSS